MLNQSIKNLVNYALNAGLIEKEDVIFSTNRLLDALDCDTYDDPKCVSETALEPILADLLDYAVKKGLIEDNITARDLFDTRLMSCLMPRPSEVIKKFNSLLKDDPKKATDYYFSLSKSSDYIRTYRTCRDIKWKKDTEFGTLDITINLSKPEKSAEEIAKAKTMKQSGYPKCLLCPENEGYRGRMNHPARSNHRIIPVTLDGEDWGFQYSPYVYYNEHCIVFNKSHVPMKVDRQTFVKLFDFVKIFPHYFLGSNAGLPIVGGSILTHEHYQGGRYTFAMETAEIEKTYIVEGFSDVSVKKVKWPMSVIRLSSKNLDSLISLADIILKKWQHYDDKSAFIFSQTDGEMHNTVTPIARMHGDIFELDLVLRNNLTTEEYPLGVFHPHKDKHNIKKENIGLIEVMGLAVLPSRLKPEMQEVAKLILDGSSLKNNPLTEKHADWVASFAQNYTFTKDNVSDILKSEIGQTFLEVLKDAGVFKCDKEGCEAFDRFMREVCRG